MSASGSFSRKLGGNGAEYAEYLEETCILDKYLGVFVDNMCFS